MSRQHRIAAIAIAVVAAGIAAVAIPVLSGAKGEPPQPASPTPLNTVVALGTGTAEIRADDEDGQQRIARAVDAAHARALPEAVRAARESAIRLARASNLTLGRIVSVDETRQVPGHYRAGRFGPGRYCAFDDEEKCVAPDLEVAQLAVTFAVR